MSTIVYRNVVLLVDGLAMHGSLNELSVEYGAEVLDETTFGDDTRIRKGGLFTARISGAGFFEGGNGEIEQLLFTLCGDDDAVFTVFPDGVTEGGTTTGMGYGMKGVVYEFTLGEAVGNLLKVTFAVEGRGIN